MNETAVGLCLAEAPLDRALLVTSLPDDAVVAHRLRTLGWRPGTQVRLVKKASGGAKIVEVGQARVAVARSLAKALTVEVVA